MLENPYGRISRVRRTRRVDESHKAGKPGRWNRLIETHDDFRHFDGRKMMDYTLFRSTTEL
jgi:hypothetical protein